MHFKLWQTDAPDLLLGGVNLFPYLSDQIGLERATRNGGLTDRKKERKMKGELIL